MNKELIIACLLLVVGLVLIIKGGDFFVDAATWIAEVSGVPKLIVGATVVSIATTLPELLVSAMAAVEGRQAAAAGNAAAAAGSVDMAIGNAIGSVTANTGLIMAIGIICIPAIIKRSDYLLKVCLLLGASALIVVVGSVWGEIGVIASILLLIIFVVAMYDNIHQALIAMKSGKEEKLGPEQKTKKIVVTNIVKFVLGAVGWLITVPRSLRSSVYPKESSPLRSLRSEPRSRNWLPRSLRSSRNRVRSLSATSSVRTLWI